MPKQITPKPTSYGRPPIQFKSRLEARWAVFLDNHPAVRSWYYEPYTLYLPKQKWEYTPDFELVAGSHHAATYVIEIKPGDVSDEYAHVLSTFYNVILAPKKIPLYVVYGDFYKLQVQVRTIGPGTAVNKNPTFEDLFPKPLAAIKAATSFRFDLK